MTVPTLERADRLVLRVGARRDHVEDRCEVEIDARARELTSPQAGAGLQCGGIDRTLAECAWDRAEAWTFERLDDAALLIRGDEEADARRRVLGRQSLHRIGDRADRGRARHALLD